MPSFVRRTWLIPLTITALFLFFAAIGRPGALQSQVPSALGAGLGNWLLALFIVWVLRSIGRLQDERVSVRAVWMVSIALVVLSLVGTVPRV